MGPACALVEIKDGQATVWTGSQKPHYTREGVAAMVRVPGQSYEFGNKRLAWETTAPLLDRASPLRTSHLRDPAGPQVHFASESFMDELAAALQTDAVELRLRYVRDPRDIAVIKAAA